MSDLLIPSPAKHVWVITDGRRGIENQAMGLAEAISRIEPYHIRTHKLTPSAKFAALPPKMQFKLKSRPDHYGITTPFPDLAIGCGRQAVAPLLSLKQTLGDKIHTVYIQDPRIDVSNFDYVIAPEHDQLSDNNVITMIGSPNRVTKERIIADTLKHTDKLSILPMPRLAMLIGGPSKSHKFSKANHDVHLSAARFAIKNGWSVLISTSRRTPDWAIKAYSDFARLNEQKVWLYTGQNSGQKNGKSANPYFAFLGGADIIFVTEDSTNMLTEACTTGKPVFRLPMDGKAGKFEHLYKTLEKNCQVRLYDPDLDPEPYEALDETNRVARALLARV